MSVDKFNPRLIVLTIIMLVVAAIRIPNAAQLTPWAQFTPIGAIALFGGAYFTKKWKAVVLSISILLISDLVINTMVFHNRYGIMYSGWYWVYFTFVIINFIGSWIIKSVTIKKVLLAAVIATIFHGLLLDFIVWAGGGIDVRTLLPLSRDFSGLLQSYAQGLPFAKNFLEGTIVYGAVMFGVYECINKWHPFKHGPSTILID